MAKKRRRRTRRDLDPATLEFMPDHLRWVACHPLIGVTKDKMTKEQEVVDAKYNKDNPCPHQLSQNMFDHYRGSPSKLDRLFFNVARYWSEHAKKKANAASEQEDVAIADLEATMAQALGATL